MFTFWKYLNWLIGFNELVERNDIVRPYVNHVTIKLLKDKSYHKTSEVPQNYLSKNSNFEKFEQDFRITPDTTFTKLKECACEFWGEKNPNEYRFYDEQLNDIFIPKEEENPSDDKPPLTVNAFFRMFQLSKAVLILKL